MAPQEEGKEARDPLPPLRRLIPALGGSGLATVYALMMFIGAAPGSDTMGKIYPKIEPALDTLNIDNEWGFFAPNPDPGTLVRYRVTDGEGTVHEFNMTEAADALDPAYLRYTTLYVSIVESPDEYEVGAVKYLCRMHADMDPRAIAFVHIEQDVVTHKEFLEGQSILDGLDITVRDAIACEDAEGFE